MTRITSNAILCIYATKTKALFVNDLGPFEADREVVFDCDVFGDAEFAVKAVGGGVEKESFGILDPQPSALADSADDGSVSQIVLIPFQLALTHNGIVPNAKEKGRKGDTE